MIFPFSPNKTTVKETFRPSSNRVLSGPSSPTTTSPAPAKTTPTLNLATTTTPPNPSDQINPSQSNYFQQSISRGCTPNNAYPFSYRPHYAKYVDPVNGTEFRIVVVPAAQAMSWDDGYACYGTQDIDSIAWANDPEHPMLILLAHDGDNDFAGIFFFLIYFNFKSQFLNFYF